MIRVTEICIFLLFSQVFCIEEIKIVQLDEGKVKGVKHWHYDYFEFFGIPYASVPKGKDRFQGPLPPEPWDGILDEDRKGIICPQPLYSDDEDGVFGVEDCLVLNIIVPTIAHEDTPRPVIVYIHSGAFAIGHGNMAQYQHVARHDVVIVNINYRLGAAGFACLGTKEIPGNAGMKDQVAALKWIKKNIKKFGGDPDNVTLAGYSVGAAMAELLYLSPQTEGYINKLILDSGSAFSHWAVNNDPVAIATNIAISIGYNDTGKIDDLTEFYMTRSLTALASKSLNLFLKNGTFGFSPCIENVHKGFEAFMTESPSMMIKKKEVKYRVPVLIGFANMEGLSRINHFVEWSDAMEENFSDFLPTNLKFPDDITMDKAVKEIKDFYFKGEEVSPDTIKEYVQYTSDAMFKYSFMKSAKLHASFSDGPVFLYEFSYVGKLSAQYNYMDIVQGASHRDQVSYILQFNSYTNEPSDLDTRDRLTTMWTSFAEFGDPTAYETILMNYKWPAYKEITKHYLHINTTVEVKTNLFEDKYKFWDSVYKKYYVDPEAPKLKSTFKTEL